MNKHVLALSTALSILAFTPAFAQEQTPAAPAVDCSLPENANNAAGITITPGAANPYPIFGTAKSVIHGK